VASQAHEVSMKCTVLLLFPVVDKNPPINKTRDIFFGASKLKPQPFIGGSNEQANYH